MSFFLNVIKSSSSSAEEFSLKLSPTTAIKTFKNIRVTQSTKSNQKKIA